MSGTFDPLEGCEAPTVLVDALGPSGGQPEIETRALPAWRETTGSGERAQAEVETRALPALPADSRSPAAGAAARKPSSSPRPGWVRPARAGARWLRTGLLAAAVASTATLVTLAARRLVHPPAAPPVSGQEVAAGAFLRALREARAGAWEAAQRELGVAAGADPSLPELSEYGAAVGRERAGQVQVAAAEQSLGSGDLAGARDALATLDAGTLAGGQGPALKDRLDEARSRRTQALLESRAAGDAGASAELVALAAAFPADAKLAAAARPPAVASAPHRTPPVDSAVVLARRLYREGDPDAALGALQQIRGTDAARLKSALLELQRARRVALRLEGEAALAPLEAALAADRILGGCPAIAGELAAKAAGTRERVGLEALRAGRLEDAYGHLTRAAAMAPGSSATRAGLARLQDRARELYLSAYVDRDADPAAAIERLQQVVRITPATDETHRKAQGWLDRLEGGGKSQGDAADPG